MELGALRKKIICFRIHEFLAGVSLTIGIQLYISTTYRTPLVLFMKRPKLGGFLLVPNPSHPIDKCKSSTIRPSCVDDKARREVMEIRDRLAKSGPKGRVMIYAYKPRRITLHR